MVVDTTIHLSDLIMAIGGAVLTAIGWGLRKTYYAFMKHLSHIDQIDEVVDTHTEVLVRAGWAKGLGLPRLSRKDRS